MKPRCIGVFPDGYSFQPMEFSRRVTVAPRDGTSEAITRATRQILNSFVAVAKRVREGQCRNTEVLLQFASGSFELHCGELGGKLG